MNRKLSYVAATLVSLVVVSLGSAAIKPPTVTLTKVPGINPTTNDITFAWKTKGNVIRTECITDFSFGYHLCSSPITYEDTTSGGHGFVVRVEGKGGVAFANYDWNSP